MQASGPPRHFGAPGLFASASVSTQILATPHGARIRFSKREACARTALEANTERSEPSRSPSNAPTHTTDGAPAPLFEARDVPYASTVHAAAPNALLLAQVLSRERTFSLSQPSGPHAALAATTTRQKMRQDFIILFAVLLLGEGEGGRAVVRY